MDLRCQKTFKVNISFKFIDCCISFSSTCSQSNNHTVHGAAWDICCEGDHQNVRRRSFLMSSYVLHDGWLYCSNISLNNWLFLQLNSSKTAIANYCTGEKLLIKAYLFRYKFINFTLTSLCIAVQNGVRKIFERNYSTRISISNKCSFAHSVNLRNLKKSCFMQNSCFQHRW